MNKSNEVLFSGYAKLPTGTTAGEMYRVIGIIVVIDMNTEKIIKADCTLATALARETVAEILIGKSLKNGVTEIAEEVETVYQGSAKKAIITTMRIILDKYKSHKDGGTIVHE